ncbi:MAG: nucleotide exchange factor GrpE [Eubacteriales bacterium]|nr:nucleotide exchange factor GrpE [Eubacteriales bacterium]
MEDTKNQELTPEEMEQAAQTAAEESETPVSEAEQKEAEADGAAQKEEKEHRKEKKDKKDQQIEELTDRVKRQMAEFENFRKRSEKEKAGMFELGSKNVIEQLLPIVDNFERGFAGLSEEQKAEPFAAGMIKVYQQMMDMFTKLEVKPIEAVGTEFNPDFHNAVMHVEDEEAGENVVVEEFLKGYLFKDQVVRHSMVKVAN